MTERDNEDTTALLPDLGELANLVEHVKATGLAYCEPDDEGNYPIWAVVSVGADTDAKATAKELHDQLEEQTG